MRRLVLALWFALTVTTGITVLAGRRQPTSARLAMLRLTDCALPCWIGIVPGKTTLDEAHAIIESAFGQSPDYDFSAAWSDSSDLLPVILSEKANWANSIWIGLRVRPDRVVDSIVFYFDRPDNPITVADLHNLFGAPSYVKLPNLSVDRSNEFVLTYGDDFSGAKIYAEIEGRLQWSEQVHTLVLYTHDQIPILQMKDQRPWEGFRTVASYYAP